MSTAAAAATMDRIQQARIIRFALLSPSGPAPVVGNVVTVVPASSSALWLAPSSVDTASVPSLTIFSAGLD